MESEQLQSNKKKTGALNYKESGVDIEKGDRFVDYIKEKVKSTYCSRVKSGVGGFASLYEMGQDRYLAVSTDGVGTKIKLAKKLGIYNTVGIDLVAMCVNDLICTGARPLFFMDYLAFGKLDLSMARSLVDGVVEGCKQAGASLIGGETAEMPGVYEDHDFDIAGFSGGEVFKNAELDGSKISEGQSLIGIPSSGPHSNGYSLLRRLIKSYEKDLMEEALKPTRIYVDMVLGLLEKFPDDVTGISHITGGGINNISRLNPNFNYHLERWADPDTRCTLFDLIEERSDLTPSELYETFNMGIGLVLVVNSAPKMMRYLEEQGEKPVLLGSVVQGVGKVCPQFI